MRKVMSLRLSAEAQERLAGLMEEQGLSAGRVVEDLILAKPAEAVPRVAPTVEDLMPVQDISSTKQVLRRKINPMTGLPFGPVPK